MQIFRACFTPKEKARTIFRALFRKNNICKPGYGACLPVVFFRASTFIFITKISKKTKKPLFFEFCLDWVWLKLVLCKFLGHVSHLGKKLEQFSVLCFSKEWNLQAWLWRLPSCRVFQSQHVHVQYRKYRKRQKNHFSLSFVWIEYDLNLSDANF